jgi:RNA-directed DNA polymerase
MSATTTDLAGLWRSISAAGSVDAYVQSQLREHGFVVKRRETDKMSKRELERYKRELKAEAAETRRLKKLGWQAYRSAHIVHLGEGIFYNDAATFDAFDLAEPEARAADNELPELAGPDDLAAALDIDIGTLRWLCFHRDAARSIHYRRFTIPKRDGSERAIWAPLPKLKAAQRWVLRNIVEHLPVHGAAHGFLAGRSVVSNAAPHVGKAVMVNIDLKDFFPTVSWRRVKGMFRKAGYREQVATLLAMLCTEAPREVVEHDGKTWYIAMGPRCLPQGAPTSPAITNALCLRLDRRISGYARKHGWTYTRYADDLTFSRKQEGAGSIGKLLGTVRAVVEDEGFAVNPKKTRVAHSGGRQQVTGLVVNDGGTPRAPRVLKRQLRAAVHNLGVGRPRPEGESMARLAGLAAWVHASEPELGARLLKAIGELAKR